MLRPLSNFKPERKDVNAILLNGGLGDHIGGSLIALQYILKHYKWINLLIWVPDFLVQLAKNLLPGACIRSFSDMRTKYNRNLITLTTEWNGRISPMKIHCVEYAFLTLCDELPSAEHKNSLQFNGAGVDLSRFELPEKYVVITTGFTAPSREFTPEAVNGVAAYVKSKGYAPLFLGSRETRTGQQTNIVAKVNSSIDFLAGIDLIDQTDLIEAAKIIQGARALVGVDNGLMHLAGCTDTPIIGGYTTVDPTLRMPYRNNQLGNNCFPVVPSSSLQCRYCQSSTNFIYGHDYRYCIYKDYECVKELTAFHFIESLESSELLNDRQPD